ncbi:MAG: transporter substrate-binding domain-containing protein [Pseudomonadota bacterium]
MRSSSHSIRTLVAAVVMMLVTGLQASAVWAAPPVRQLKVMVLKDSPNMSYRNAQGELVGFNADMARLLCETIRASCEILETQLATVVDQVASGEADFSTASLLPTPDRLKKVVFTIPVRWSRSFLIAAKPIGPGLRVAVVEGSRQHAWVERVKAERRWTVVPVALNAGLDGALSSGEADAVVAPFTTTVGIVQDGRLGQAGALSVDPISDPELSLPTTVAVNPAKPELLQLLNNAIRDVQSNGKMDQLNSKYFPLRML